VKKVPKGFKVQKEKRVTQARVQKDMTAHLGSILVGHIILEMIQKYIKLVQKEEKTDGFLFS
jgi:plastocyanin domain-containing protein